MQIIKTLQNIGKWIQIGDGILIFNDIIYNISWFLNLKIINKIKDNKLIAQHFWSSKRETRTIIE